MAFDKIVDSAFLEAGLTLVGDSIRAKGGTSAKLEFPNGMKAAVEAIDTSENLDDVLTAQESLIDQIQTALEGKAAGGGMPGVCTISINKDANSTFDIYIDLVHYVDAETGNVKVFHSFSTATSYELTTYCGFPVTMDLFTSWSAFWSADFDTSSARYEGKITFIAPDTPGTYNVTISADS